MLQIGRLVPQFSFSTKNRSEGYQEHQGDQVRSKLGTVRLRISHVCVFGSASSNLPRIDREHMLQKWQIVKARMCGDLENHMRVRCDKHLWLWNETNARIIACPTGRLLPKKRDAEYCPRVFIAFSVEAVQNPAQARGTRRRVLLANSLTDISYLEAPGPQR
jgi:hypothetical protein